MSYRKDFDIAFQQSPFAANTVLWQWLQSDYHRANLYREVRESDDPVLAFNSRISMPTDGADKAPGTASQQTTYLLTRKDHIEQAFRNFSNSPYKALGPGYPVVLASDNNDQDQHELKRKLLSRAFLIGKNPDEIKQNLAIITGYSCYHAMVLSRQKDHLDFISNIAQEAALFYVEGLYGIEFSNHPVLHEAMEAIYNGMAYQMLARHFITEPGVPMKSLMGEGALVQILDTALRKAMNPKLHTELSDLLARFRPTITPALKVFLKQVKALDDPNLDQNLAGELDHALQHDQHISFHATQFIDQALNLYNVRVWVDDGLRGDELGGGHCLDEVRLLVDLIRCHKREKESPDDNLIPIKQLDPKTQNYRIRETVLSRLAANPDLFKAGEDFLSGSEFINELAGAIAGTVGNFMSSAAIVVKEVLLNSKGDNFKGDISSPEKQTICDNLIMEALRLDPPAPFLPRLVVTGREEERTLVIDAKKGLSITLDEGSNVLLAMGSLTHAATTSESPEIFNPERDNENLKEAYAFVFGQANGDDLFSHRCIGDRMALPFIRTLLQNLFTLHDLAFEDEDKLAEPLVKKWGFICQSLPLVHKSIAEIKQQPLNVVMKVKTPIAVHAEYLKKIVYYGAPVVQNLLTSSNVVHDARFVMLNDDNELALLTTYDGGYEEYMEYFAEKAGPLFDMIFEHIQDAPPTPVRDNSLAFAKHIERFNVRSVASYFYSAYPQSTVAEILRAVKYSELTTSPEVTKALDNKSAKPGETNAN